jgi:hypothetical protein
MKFKTFCTLILFSIFMSGCPAPMMEKTSNTSTENTAVTESANSPPVSTPETVNTAASSNAAKTNGDKQSYKLPPFPMPPNATVEYPLDASLIKKPNGQTTLGDVDDRLRQALSANGYEDAGYYSIPGGFAIATAAEQFQSNGQPAARGRFSDSDRPPSTFSTDYWRNILSGREGRYRVIAFIVTDQNYTGSEKTPSFETGKNLIYQGAKFLPAEMRPIPFTARHKCIALVYEFGRDRKTGNIYYVRRSSLTATQHLQNLLKTLKGG